MNDNKILNALSYFSVLFAPFLVPLIIWIVAKDLDVKYHAKRSFLSHIIPVVLFIITGIVFFASAIASNTTNSADTGLGISAVFFIITIIVYFIIFIWNLIQGIKVLVRD